MSTELKPCPFCGSSAEAYPDGEMEGHTIMCSGKTVLFGGEATNCPLATFGFATHEAAAAAWNRRATPAPGAPGQEAAAVQAVGAAEQMLKALKFHPSASHVSPDFRDNFNATLQQHFDNYVRYGAGAGEKTS